MSIIDNSHPIEDELLGVGVHLLSVGWPGGHIGGYSVSTQFTLENILYPPNGGYSGEHPHLHDDGLVLGGVVVGPSNLVRVHHLLLPTVSQSSLISWQKLSMSMMAPPVSQVNLVMRAGPHAAILPARKLC